MRAIVVIAILLAAAAGCSKPASRKAQPRQKIIVACTTQPDGALVHIAAAKGFFAEEGLEVQLQQHSFGKAALKSVLDGKADLATVAETPVMFAALNNEPVCIVAGICTSSKNNAIIGRRDRAIRNPRDLKGKRIGYTPGTTSEFFMESLLMANGAARKDVVLVGLKPEELEAALAAGKVDAVSTWNFSLARLSDALGENGVTFFDSQIYTETFTLVARQESVHKDPETVRRTLRALVKAEKFAHEHPNEAQDLAAASLKVDRNLLRKVWGCFNLKVEMDQGLVITLEDETRWAMKNRLVPHARMPNYSSFIYLDGLMAVKHDAVTINR
jgi:ABC-type nitrate/sulfonate/bicarbonate transport system substrate-binding protein